MRLGLLGVAAALSLCSSLDLLAQGRTVAITVDDLPYADGTNAELNIADVSAAEMINRELLAAFQKRHVPVTGFVIQKRVESLGSTSGVRILKHWIDGGFDLGNHTYSHADINNLSPEEIEREIVQGETAVAPLMKEVGKEIVFFRFPMNHTGDTKLKHDNVATYLAQRGYRLATCTIDTSDFLFNNAYIRMLAIHDDAAAQKLRLEYLAYTKAEVDYYAALNRQVLGYEPPQVMMLHDNRLNGAVIDKILRLFEEKHYRFVPLGVAQSDPAYRLPDGYITKFGPMWGYRWAKELSVKVNGNLEPDPPKWILDYGKPSTTVAH
jgi:peptidoglycan/xylan/chitin deacetylase (PgdA/CDA1 family)